MIKIDKNLLAAACVATLFVAHINALKAEPYIAGGVGYAFSQKIDSLKGNENTNYPLDPDPAGGSPLLPGAKISPLKLEASSSVNIKAGYYLEKYPMLGFEGELAYSRPNFKRQNVTITHDGYNDVLTNAGLPAQGYVTEDQLYARSNLFVLSTNAMYRYQGIKDITPFIGGGPALFILNIKGTGFSGIMVDPPVMGSGESGPRVNQTSVNVGLNLKAGVEYALTKDIGLGLEYHYNWAPIKVDNFRSISDAKGNFSAHTVGLFIAKHF